MSIDKEREAFEAWWDSSEGIDNAGPWMPDSPIQFAWAAWRAVVDRASLEAVPDGFEEARKAGVMSAERHHGIFAEPAQGIRKD